MIGEMVDDLHRPVSEARSLISVWMVLYRKETGEITQVMSQSPDLVGPLVSDEIGHCEIPGAGLSSYLQGLAYAQEHCVDTRGFYPAIRKRAPCPATMDGVTLRGLPLPCRIEISAPLNTLRVYEESEASELDLGFTHPDTYTVRVLSTAYLPGSFTVTV